MSCGRSGSSRVHSRRPSSVSYADHRLPARTRIRPDNKAASNVVSRAKSIMTTPVVFAVKRPVADRRPLRTEIRDFLSTRRARITPEEAGLPAYGGNRRVKGLRREEVALLAGIWLTSSLWFFTTIGFPGV